MSGSTQLLQWLEHRSDLLSAIVVKEVRQVVRGREFIYSLGAALLAGLAVAFFGAADALTGTGTAGRWTSGVLMGCLSFLGLFGVPVAAFNALRTERVEQTLELITLTALTPRRVIIGKLLTQGIKLGTLFAATAPFLAMCFLLGGIDFATILISLAVLFVCSLWVCAAALFLSSLLKSRAMMAIVFGGAAILVLMVVSLGRMIFMVIFGIGMRGGGIGATSVSFFGVSGTDFWWALAMTVTFVAATMTNLVLLAEHRLSLATENRVTPLRIGFLVQFLLLVAWTLSFINAAPGDRSDAVDVLGVFGCLHLALVAMFTVTEDLAVPRRVLLNARGSSGWRSLFGILRPGGGYGALYVLVQMVLLLAAAWVLQASWLQLRWCIAACGYICFFTGLPTFAFRFLKADRRAALKLRVAVLLTLPLATVLPDLLYYVLWQPEVLDLSFSTRHLVNPLRTLPDWSMVEKAQWYSLPFAMGLAGLLAYLALIYLALTMAAEVAPTDRRGSAVKAGEHPSADVIY
jgi:hypothetical protein